MVTRWLYRVWQFRRAVGARPSSTDATLLARYLSGGERRLFETTSPRDQRHHVETLRLLCREGAPSRELARAALLHDVGKGYIRLHERVLYVLLAAGAPPLLRRLARRDGRGLRGALYRIHHHAHLAVDLLRPVGVTARELELIARHHQSPHDDDELRRLIRADERA